jgi:Fe-S cluster biogenesis protein NfuA
VRSALERLRPHLAERGARVELIEVRGGVARVRFSGGSGCGSAALRDSVRRAVEDAAPELSAVELEEPAGGLVQLRLQGSAP